MKVIPIKRNGDTIAHVWDANSYFTRLRGLLGRALPRGGGLILTPCNSIHTFGMRYAIDAVYLDCNGVVLRVDVDLPRGRAWRPQRGARSVLELAAGEAAAYNIRAGDRLEVCHG